MVAGQTQKPIPGKSFNFLSLSNPWDAFISVFPDSSLHDGALKLD